MTILAGARITADDILTLQGRLPIRARSTTATTFTSNTTFGNLTGLSAAVAANQVYKVRGRLKVTGANTTHDLKIQWSLPASATVEWSAAGGAAGSVTNAINSLDMGSTSGI